LGAVAARARSANAAISLKVGGAGWLGFKSCNFVPAPGRPRRWSSKASVLRSRVTCGAWPGGRVAESLPSPPEPALPNRWGVPRVASSKSVCSSSSNCAPGSPARPRSGASCLGGMSGALGSFLASFLLSLFLCLFPYLSLAWSLAHRRFPELMRASRKEGHEVGGSAHRSVLTLCFSFGFARLIGGITRSLARPSND